VWDTTNESIVGFGSIILCNTIRGKVGKIENIVTSEKVRGIGLGKMIIELLKDIGWSKGCKFISLFCEEKNIKFYEKLKFGIIGNITACYT
jgi:ribosomal protein S18 acetylase RimI-like enzyme